jgi:predicted metalloprotease
MKTKLLVVLALVVGAFVFKINPFQLLGLSSSSVAPVQSGAAADPETRAYLATMMADNETVWQEILAREGITYRPAKLVIYSGRTQTPAGLADAGMGPF